MRRHNEAGDAADDAESVPLSDTEVCAAATAIAEHGVMLLAVLIDRGPDGDYAVRDAVASMLGKWPLLCSSSRIAIRDQPTYAPMIFYERTRRGKTNKHWFLDGLPPSLPVFGAPTALEFPEAQMRELLYDDVIGERHHTITKLEAMPQGSPKRKQLAESLDKLPDLDKHVPQTVRLFVSRVRSMCQGIRSAKPSEYFRQCANAHCCRFYYRGERANDLIGSAIVPRTQEPRERSYWKACSEAPMYDVHRFCCGACQRQWYADWARVVPDVAIAYNPERDKRIRGKSHSRVAGALEAALARNGVVSRAIAKLRKRIGRKTYAVARSDLNRELAARLDMLNIDTGLLYASSIVARVPSRQRERCLPGSRDEWRCNGENSHRNALIRVARIYRQHPESLPVGHRLETPAYFRVLKAQATVIF